MTGQSVDDERKFNYRKSMHLVLQHIWRIPVHKQAVKVSYMSLLCKYLPLYFSWSWILFFSQFLIVNTFWSERCFIHQRRCSMWWNWHSIWHQISNSFLLSINNFIILNLKKKGHLYKYIISWFLKHSLSILAPHSFQLWPLKLVLICCRKPVNKLLFSLCV